VSKKSTKIGPRRDLVVVEDAASQPSKQSNPPLEQELHAAQGSATHKQKKKKKRERERKTLDKKKRERERKEGTLTR
jgi:hypothetical protein